MAERVISELSPERAAAWCGPGRTGDVRWAYDDTPLEGPPYRIPVGDGGLYERTKHEILALQHRKQELVPTSSYPGWRPLIYWLLELGPPCSRLQPGCHSQHSSPGAVRPHGAQPLLSQ